MRFGHAVPALMLLVALAVGWSLLAGAESELGKRRVGTAGVTLVIPRSWRALAARDLPHPYADPVVRLVAASTSIAPDPLGCKAETFRIGRGGVAILVVEWRHPSPGARLRARPARLTPKTLPVRRHEVECWNGPGGAIRFREHGRDIGAYLLAGTEAPPRLLALARSVLGSIAVSRRRVGAG